MRGSLSTAGQQPFSWSWVIASVVIFTALEVLFAVLLAPLLFGGWLLSHTVRVIVELVVHLGSYLVGGVLVGVISPGLRLLEPAVGAFCSVVLVLFASLFLPLSAFHWSFSRLLLGGGIAFVCGLGGAYVGERVMGNLGPGDDGGRARLRNRLWGDRGLLGRRRG
ncbi:MAG: hypothetical protein RBU45_25065 [Myxococcota bacterium]|nr:hypothetical protein [Myxococcota bacterium]